MDAHFEDRISTNGAAIIVVAVVVAINPARTIKKMVKHLLHLIEPTHGHGGSRGTTAAAASTAAACLSVLCSRIYFWPSK